MTPEQKLTGYDDIPAETAVSFQAAPLIESLRAQAQKILGAVFSELLSGFTVGSLGNFPYYLKNPNNLQFNHLTYNWITRICARVLHPCNWMEVLRIILYRLSARSINNLRC